MNFGLDYDGLCEIQAKLIASILAETTEPKDRASLAQAFVKVIDQKRIIRMRPKPKDIDVSILFKKGRSIDIEPIEQELISVAEQPPSNGDGIG